MQNDHPRHPNANGGTTLRSCIPDGRSTLCLELAGPLGCDDVGESKKAWRATTCVAGNRALVIDLGLLMAIDGAGRRLLSLRKSPRSLAIHVAPVPALCEPCGIWVYLDASQER